MSEGIPHKQNISSSQEACSRFDIVMREDSIIGKVSMKRLPRKRASMTYFYIL